MIRRISLTVTGLETLLIGIVLLLQRHLFQDDPNDQLIHVSQHMGDFDWALILIAIGIVATLIGASSYNRFHARSIMVIILSGLWFAYTVAFLLQDIHFPGVIGIQPVMAGFVFIQLLIAARFGGEGR